MTAAFNDLDKSWNRVFRTMYLAKVYRTSDNERWTTACFDHDGRLLGQGTAPAALNVEEALDAAEALCPNII